MKKLFLLSLFFFAPPIACMKRAAQEQLTPRKSQRQRAGAYQRPLSLATWHLNRQLYPQQHPSRILTSIKNVPGHEKDLTEQEAKRHVGGIKPRFKIPLSAILSSQCFEIQLLFPAGLYESPEATCEIINKRYWIAERAGIYRADTDSYPTKIPTPNNPRHPDSYNGSLLDFAFFKGMDSPATSQEYFLTYMQHLKQLAGQTCVIFWYKKETTDSSLLHQLPKCIHEASGEEWKRTALKDFYMFVLRLSNPNLKDKHGQTPLRLASYYGLTDCIDALIAQGAELNLKDNSGFSALGCAILKGRRSTIEKLHALQSKVTAVDLQAFGKHDNDFYEWYQSLA